MFLYGLIIQAILGLSLNILFAAREINLTCYLFIKPILVQMTISISAVVATTYMVNNVEYINIVMLIIKGGLFALLYVLLNYIIKTSSFNCFSEQVMPVLQKKIRYKVES